MSMCSASFAFARAPLPAMTAKRPSPKPASSACAAPPPPAARRARAAAPPPRARPVFLRAALRRLARQPTWPRRLRSLRLILSFLLSDASWWLRAGLRHLPATLRAARPRVSLPLHRGIPSPSVDVYAPAHHAAYLAARLSALSCRPAAARRAAPPPPAPPAPVVLYVHGGAWGAGRPAHYAQLAASLARRAHATVLVLDYRLYPAARMHHQVADVAAALRYARRLFPARPLAALAHSSGAQLTALALLRAAQQGDQLPLADVLITTAAPFHLMHHFLFEAARGVADVSPMLPAACAERDPTQFDVCSPTCLVEAFDGLLQEAPALPPAPDALEGQLAAANVYLPQTERNSQTALRAPFPRTYVMTSSCDTVVPMYSSLRFAAALRRVGLESKLLVYDFTDHVDFVTDWFDGAQSRDLSDVLDVCEEDRERRLTFLTMLNGPPMAELAKEDSHKLGPTPYVRDVIRILKGLTAASDPDDDDIV